MMNREVGEGREKGNVERSNKVTTIGQILTSRSL